MSEYNKKYFLDFFENDNCKNLLFKLNKFKNIEPKSVDNILNAMKITKKSIEKLHRKILKNNKDAVIEIPVGTVNFYTAKCFDNFANYKGTVSYVTDTFVNKNFDDSFSALMNSKYFYCKDSNKYPRVIKETNKHTLILINFSTKDYSGRSLYRYLMTKIILGKDYEPNLILENINSYSGFYKDGTLGQEIIYYFMEIYCYDRYNFFRNMSTKDYLLLNNKKDIVHNELSEKINEFLNNKNWQYEYPAFDGAIYIDKFDKIIDDKQSGGIETIIFINEIFLKEINNIYINDGTNFKKDIKDVSPNTNPKINMNKLNCLLREEKSDKQIMVGGFYNKYIKYKKKYLSLKNN